MWPPSGFALAGVLVCGLRVWPAIFVAAFAAALPAGFADAEAADLVLIPLALRRAARSRRSSAAISSTSGPRAAGPSIRRRAFANLRWSCLGPSALIGALVNAGSLYLAADAQLDSLLASGAVRWLRELAGALVVAPAVVLWAVGSFRPFDPDKVLSSSVGIVAATLVGLIAFSPLFEHSAVPDRADISGAAAVAVVRACRRGTRYRDRRAHLIVLCGLGSVSGRRPVRAGELPMTRSCCWPCS